MNSIYSNLDNHSLHESLVATVGEEKRAIDLVVEHLKETQRRKSYLDLGYGSMFDYLTKGLGYSESAAWRRIQAARLVLEVPEAVSLNVTQASMLQTYFKKTGETELTVKRELVSVAHLKSQRDLEKILVERSPEIRSMKPDVIKPITPDTVELRFVASSDLQNKLEKLKNLLAHRFAGGNSGIGDLVEKMADMLLEKFEPKEDKALVATTKTGHISRASAAPAAKVHTRSRYIPAGIRREIWSKAQGQCQYCDSKSGRRCDPKYALEIDHLVPFSKNGENTIQNLQLLCRAHNLNKGSRTH